MTIRNALASVPVRELAAALAWYEKLLGRPPDSQPMSEVAEWKFERGGWLQVYAAKERAGGGSVTLAVDDIDAQIATLRRVGIDPGRTLEGKARVVMINDPDGNSIAFAEARDPRLAA